MSNNRPTIKYLLHTSLYTAACVLALCLGAERMMLGYLPPLASPLHFLIVGGTMLEYNVHHLFNRPIDGSTSWSVWALQIHWIMCGIGLALCLPVLPRLSMQVLTACAAMGLLSLAYSTPLLPFRYKQRLKDFGLLKILVLTGVWVLVSTMLPALYWHIQLRIYWPEAAIRFLLIFSLCIAFDIRDAKQDLARDIHTLPNTLGVPAAYRAIDVTLLAFLVLGTINCIILHHSRLLLLYAGTAAAAHFAIRLSRRRPHPYVYLALVDGVVLLYGGLQCVL